MFFKELVIQGLFGIESGTRLPLTDGLCEPLLLPPLTVEQFTQALALVLYPHTLPEEQPELVESDAEHIRIGARLAGRDVDYKFVWDLKSANLQLYAILRDETLELRAQSREEVETFWKELLALPPLELFHLLHCHHFPSSSAPPTSKRERLILAYRTSLTVERIEAEQNDIEIELKRLQDQSSPTSKLEDKLALLNRRLAKFDKLPEFVEEDRAFIGEFETVQTDLKEELATTNTALENARTRLEAVTPRSFIKSPIFWLGIVIAAASLGIAFTRPELRIAALGDILGLGLVAVVLLRFVSRRESFVQSRTQVRELERKRTQLEKDIQKRESRIERIKRQCEVATTFEILEGLQSRDDLRAKREAVFQDLQKQLEGSDNQVQRKQLQELEARLQTTKDERSRYENNIEPSFELAEQLKALGVDAHALKPIDAPPETPFLDAGRALGVLPEEGLRKSDLEAFKRVAKSSIGDNARVDFDKGCLTVAKSGDLQPLAALDTRARRPWFRVFALTLSLQHHRLRVKEQNAESPSILILDDPWHGMQRDERIQHYTLLKEVARSFQIIIPKLQGN